MACSPGAHVAAPRLGGLARHASDRYRHSPSEPVGQGRLQAVGGAGNPAFAKFAERSLAIAAELESVAAEVGRSEAQVALNWVANRPGVASVIVGATRLAQPEDNLGAFEFSRPDELTASLDRASGSPATFPYSFFTPGMQAILAGSHMVRDKPEHYWPRTRIDDAVARR